MRGIVVSPFALFYLCLIFLSKIYPFFFFFPLLLLFLSLLCLPYASLPYLTFHNFPFFSFFFPHSSSPIHPFPNLRPILLSPLLLYLCPNSHFPRTILIHYINTTSVLPPLPTACAFPLTPSSYRRPPHLSTAPASSHRPHPLSNIPQAENARRNAFLFIRLGAIPVLVQLLDMEIENTSAANSALRKPAVSIADSADIRVILNIIYHIVEAVWRIAVDAEESEKIRSRERGGGAGERKKS